MTNNNDKTVQHEAAQAGVRAASAGDFGAQVRAAILTPTTKTITWEEGKWHCEPLIVKVFCSTQNNQKEQIKLEPTKTYIKINDSNNWLERGEIKQDEDGKSLLVEIKVSENAADSIFPSQKGGGNSSKIVGQEQIEPSPPKNNLETTLSLNVTLLEDVAGAVKAAGAGMAVLGPLVSAGLGRPKKVEFPPEQLTYVVSSKPTLTIDKVGWQSKKEISLPDLIKRVDFEKLQTEGGIIKVRAICKHQQNEITSSLYHGQASYSKDANQLNFSPFAINDVVGTINWMGEEIIGDYDDEDKDHEFLLFKIRDNPKIIPTKTIEMEIDPFYRSIITGINRAVLEIQRILKLTDDESLHNFNQGVAEYLASNKQEMLKKNDKEVTNRLWNLSIYFRTCPKVIQILNRVFLLKTKAEQAAIKAHTEVTMNVLNYTREELGKKTSEKIYKKMAEDNFESIRKSHLNKVKSNIDRISDYKKQISIEADRSRIELVNKLQELSQKPSSEKQIRSTLDGLSKINHREAAKLKTIDIVIESNEKIAEWFQSETLMNPTAPVNVKIDDVFTKFKQELGDNPSKSHLVELIKTNQEDINRIISDRMNAYELSTEVMELYEPMNIFENNIPDEVLSELIEDVLGNTAEDQLSNENVEDIKKLHSLMIVQQEQENNIDKSLYGQVWDGLKPVASIYWGILEPLVNAGRRMARGDKKDGLTTPEGINISGDLTDKYLASKINNLYCGTTIFLFGLANSIMQIIVSIIKLISISTFYILNQLNHFLRIPYRNITNLPTNKSTLMGLNVAEKVGKLPVEFLKDRNMDRFLEETIEKIRPDSDTYANCKDVSIAIQLAGDLQKESINEANDRNKKNLTHLGLFYLNLTKGSFELEVDRLQEQGKDKYMNTLANQVNPHLLANLLDRITANIEDYDRALTPPREAVGPGAEGFKKASYEYVANLSLEAVKAVEEAKSLKRTWAHIDNYLTIIGNQCALILRVAALGLSKKLTTQPLALKLTAAAENADNFTSGLRLLIALTCIIPNVNAFAFDMIAYQGLEWKFMVENTLTRAEMDDLLGVKSYNTWKEL